MTLCAFSTRAPPRLPGARRRLQQRALGIGHHVHHHDLHDDHDHDPAAIAANPEWLSSDGLHHTKEGQEAFAELLAASLRTCPGVPGPAG